jgi:hypothetical protein
LNKFSSITGSSMSTFEIGYIRNDNPIGAYAISVTLNRPKLCFAYEVPFYKKVYIRIKIWRKGARYLA